MAVNQLKSGAFLSYLSLALNVLIGLLYTPYMLRMLGQSEYGLYSLSASLIAYLTVLDLGFGNAIIRYTAKFRAEKKIREQEEMFGMFFLLYMGIGAVVIGIGFILYANVENWFSARMTLEEEQRIRALLMLMTFNLAFTFPMSIWGAIMTAYERFVFQRVVSMIRNVLNPLVMIVLLAIGYKAVALVVVTTLFNVITLCINGWYCHDKLDIRICLTSFKWGFLKEVSIYSFWIFLNVVMDRIYWGTGQLILGIYRGVESVAIYSVAMQLKDIFFMFSTVIAGVFLPKVTAMITSGASANEVSDLFIRTGRIQYMIMGFILAGFILFGHPFVTLWAGSDYGEAYYIALLLFIPASIPLIQNVGITILMARGEMRFRSLAYLFITLCSLAVQVVLAKRLGGVGCALAIGIAVLIGQGVVMNVYYHKAQKINIAAFWRQIGKMSMVPFVMTVTAWFALKRFAIYELSDLVTAIGIFSLIYILFFYQFGLNDYERDLFGKPIKQAYKKLFG